MKSSYPKNGTTVVPITNKQLGERVTAAILPFRHQEVADAANRTTEAVKKWRPGLCCPDSASLLNMGRNIPAIKWLIYEELERGTPEGIITPRFITEARQLLTEIAARNGEHSDKAREILFGANAVVRPRA